MCEWAGTVGRGGIAQHWTLDATSKGESMRGISSTVVYEEVILTRIEDETWKEDGLGED